MPKKKLNIDANGMNLSVLKRVPDEEPEEEETAINSLSLQEPMVKYLEQCLDAIDVNQGDCEELRLIQAAIMADYNVLYQLQYSIASMMGHLQTRNTVVQQVSDAIIARKQKEVSR